MRTQKSKKSKRRPPERPPADEALLHLRLIQHGTHIVEMFKKFFPAEFKAEGVDYSSCHTLLASYDCFADLVDAKLFPVHNFSSNDLIYEEPEGCLDTMHICLHSFPNMLWYENFGNFRSFGLVERMIVSAAGYETFPDVDLRLPKDWRFSTEKLQEACWKEQGMVSRLWLAAVAVLGGTGNCWLDCTEDEYYQAEPPDWGETQIEWLAAEYEEAQRIKKDVEQFFAWVDRPSRVATIRGLLQRAQYVDKPRARV